MKRPIDADMTGCNAFSSINWNIIDTVFEQNSKSLRELALAAGKDPNLFYVDRDFRGLTLKGIDLRNVNLSGSNLTGTGLRFAIIDHSTTLDRVRLDRADTNWLRRNFARPEVPVSRIISPHMPQLRRFARALVGSQKGGDSYVVVVLEHIASHPAKILRSNNPRVDLYAIFLNIWQKDKPSLEIDGVDAQDDETETSSRISSLSIMPRIALLLTALEGFDVIETARAIGCTVDEARQLLETANAEIAIQIAADVLIIEDEPLTAMDIQQVVEDLGHRVTRIASTHEEALESAQRHRPGLILADIQLADGSSGLDAVNDILDIFEVPVIFITSFPERFLSNSPPEPCFMIAKPFSVEPLRAVISQVLFFDRESRRRSSSIDKNVA